MWTKLYVGGAALVGLVCLSAAALEWQPRSIAHFVLYLILTLLTSQLKVKLPRVDGTMSVLFVFVLLAALELNSLETIAIASIGTLAQCLRQTRRSKTIQLAFNVSNATISSYACCTAVGFVSHFPVYAFLAILAGASAYFLVNTIAVSGIISISESGSFLKIFSGNAFWAAPQYVCSTAAVWLLDKLQEWISWEIYLLLLPMFYFVYQWYRLYLGQLSQEQKHVQEMTELQLRTIRALTMAIQAKGESTQSHLRRVQVYAMGLARHLPLDELQMKALEAAAVLHDIGHLAVPEYILSKPGILTAEELQKMNTHPIVGADILTSIGFPYPVAPIVRSHHEKWDGTGYPDGLKGEEIPIGARILAIADSLDALISERLYRPKVSVAEAVEMVASQAGISFDPRLLAILGEHFDELEAEVQRGEAAMPPPSEPDKPADLRATPVRDSSTSFISSIASARQEFQMLLEVTADLGKSLRMDETFALLGSRLKTMVPHDAMAIFVMEEAMLKPRYTSGVEDWLLREMEIPTGQGLSGWVVGNCRPILNGDPAREPGYAARGGTQLCAAISVPLEATTGVIGALTLYRSAADSFNNDHMRVLLAISSKAALTIENALEYNKARVCAITDELTGLPNARSLFLELERELSHALRKNTTLTILVIDLNGFKQVNDRFGHLMGNQMLAEVARILGAWCREYDYVARMGGDEFVLLLRDIAPEDLAARIDQLQASVVRGGEKLVGEPVVSLSIGQASFPADGKVAEELLGLADKRMYQMKQLSKLARAVANPPESPSLAPS